VLLLLHRRVTKIQKLKLFVLIFVVVSIRKEEKTTSPFFELGQQQRNLLFGF
jgi:hypothetical protein